MMINRPASRFATVLVALLIGCALLMPGSCPAYEVPQGIPYVVVPPGSFQMGQGGDPDAYMDEWPSHVFNIPYEYAVSTYEITNAQYANFLNTVGVTADADGNRYIDESDPDIKIELVDSVWQPKHGWGNYPMVEVSWYGANAYCRWLGGRLPTEEEWEKASRGTDGRMWPWGNDFLPPGEDPRYPQNPRCSFWWANRMYQDPPVKPYPVGTFPDFPSPYGAHDMAGNAWEWTMGGYSSYPNGPLSFIDHSREVQRGGSWTNSDYNLRCATRSPQPRYMTDGNLGFRVLWSDHEPVVPTVLVPPRETINEWIEDFNVATPMDEIRNWWGNGRSFAIDAANGWMVASLHHPSYLCGEYMAMIRRDTGDLFQPGDYVDITVRIFCERGDRGYARSSVGVAWGDDQGITPGGRGADENFGYPWYLIANNTDAPMQWQTVTAKRVKWGVGKLCIGFGLWSNLANEAIPPINGQFRMWVDWVHIRHSTPDAFEGPAITDEGIYTSSTSELRAWWPSNYSIPINQYRYAIGTSPDDLITPWKIAGLGEMGIETGLSLEPGQTYYWYVKARHNTTWSNVSASDGITVLTAASSIPTAKGQHAGNPVMINDAVVTSRPGDGPGLWVQTADRASGLKILASDWQVDRGDVLQVAGVVNWQDIVPVLSNPELKNKTAGDIPAPLSATNRNIALMPTESAGLSPIGLLMTTWGQVSSVDAAQGVFYVNDGSTHDGGILDGSFIPNGLRVVMKPGMTPPSDGVYAVITGIRTVDAGQPVLFLRDQADLSIREPK